MATKLISSVHEGDLILDENNVSKIPEGLLVKGDLYLPKNLEILSLPANLKIEGDFHADRCRLKVLPNGFHVNGKLHGDTSEIEWLPEGLFVGKDLYISNSRVQYIPPRLYIGGGIDITDCDIKYLPDDLHAREIYMFSSMVQKVPQGVSIKSIFAQESELIELPENMFFEHLDLRSSKIEKLPSQLTVTCSLTIDDTNILELPADLEIGGSLSWRKGKGIFLPDHMKTFDDLDLAGSEIQKLSDGLYINGDLDLSDTKNLLDLPQDLTIGGTLNLSNSQIENIPDDSIAEGGLILNAPSSRPIIPIAANLEKY